MCRHCWLVIGIWMLAAGALNVVVPQLEHVVAERSGPFIPDSAPSLATLSHMGSSFGESPATAIGYLIFEDSSGLSDADHRFATDLLAQIGANRAAIDSVQDLAGAPATAPVAISPDGQAMYAVVRFRGGMGSAQARRGQAFVESALARTGAPAGLRIHLTGPAPTIGDELATEDRTVLLITGLSVVMIVVLLLIVYRSVATIVVPLASVGLALAVARPIVALLGAHAGMDVSIFSVMLLAALILGGGTDYAIFLLSGYHEARRGGAAWQEAVGASMSRTAAVIVASGLTVAASCAVMAVTKVVLFRTAGLPCSLGMLIAVAASVTLVPALMALLGRHGRLEPRAGDHGARRWRRAGVRVVRRPAATLAASAVLLIVLAAHVPRMITGYDERVMQPADTASNLGYDAIARHFDPNELTPDYVVIDADHDLRNAKDFSALNQASRAAASVAGVKQVRSVTQPQGAPIPEFTLAGQDRMLADRLGAAVEQLRRSRPQLDQLRDGVARLDDGLGLLSAGAGAATGGSGRIADGSATLRNGLARASGSSGTLADGADRLAAGSLQLADGIEAAVQPLLGVLNTLAPGAPCPDGSCDPGQLDTLAADGSPLGKARYELSRLKTGSRQLADGNAQLASGARQLRDGLSDAAHGSTTLAAGQALLTSKLSQLTRGAVTAHDGTDTLSAGVDEAGPQLQDLVDGLTQARNLLAEVGGGAEGTDAGFHVPATAFSDPRLGPALAYFLSGDGHSARLMVINRTAAYSPDAIGRTEAVTAAVRGALAGTSLADSPVAATGLASGFADLHHLVLVDFAVLAGCALVFIFVILAVLLRSLVAPLYLLVTIAVSYAAALGLTILVWQDLCGIDIYWAVPPLAFVALVAVGSDYNIMLMSRIREESASGSVRAGIVRAFAATGGVVSTAGIVFAVTMLAMLASPTHSIGQVGSTIGVGLLLDTFVVRTLTVPAIAALLGRANWWPGRTESRAMRVVETDRDAGE
jgi:putative drug exporter of the RND superfamily